ncbi:hypothetical protein BH11PSE10_BH11PSE10_10670 [soil metagenome]
MAAVLTLHALLWLTLQAAWQRAAIPPTAGRITLRLPPLIQPRPPLPLRQATAVPTRARAAANRQATPALAKDAAPADIEAAQTQSQPQRQSQSPPPATERSTLLLTLPPLAASAPRNRALTDPRTNTARLTLEEKMARALDGTVHTQLQADGTTIRRRVGNQCVDLHESRAVKLMPDVDFLRYAPVAAGRAYDCK